MSAVAKRYAKAAVEAAEQEGGLEAVAVLSLGLSSFAQAYQESSELQELLANPILKEHRDHVFSEVLKELGLSDSAGNLLRILAANDRMRELSEVASLIIEYADDKAGRVRVTVTSAVDLDAAQRARVVKALAVRLQREIVLIEKTDPDLLGGLVCRVGDVAFDGSLRRQLEKLTEQLSVDVA